MELPAQDPEEINSLESQPTPDVAGGTSDTPEKSEGEGDKKPAEKKKKTGSLVQRLISHVNIYLLIFIFLVVLAAIGTFISMNKAKKQAEEPTLTTQDLTQEALEQINQSEVKVGDPKQTLAIESNAIFSGKVLVKDSLDVAGTIRVGSALNLPGITVSGTSSFDQLQANKLSVSGDVGIQGTVSIQSNLTVAGGATFGGPISAPQITAQSIRLTSDLSITRHIDAGGPSPGLSKGTALGSGGTASVSGTDTAGTVGINTGGGTSAGCFATITFSTPFNGTPHIALSPVGSGAGGLQWYINRTSSNFSICTNTAAPASSNFSFDYVAVD